jgi:alpha-galactosidase
MHDHRLALACLLLCIATAGGAEDADAAVILTPPPAALPRINGPSVFGVRPGSPLLYTIPATGEKPLTFAAEGLPSGVRLDPATGRITGTLAQAGEHALTLTVSNAAGKATRAFRIVVGDRIALTPAMGWNSWNCWAEAVDQDKVLRSARTIVSSGLAAHGWTYVNIDDTWQGARGGSFGGIQGNAKFPDMKALCDQIHGMGLKAGIYSTPWVTSYAGFIGGSSDDAVGAWSKDQGNAKFWKHGAHSFADGDAKQWGAWGFDYLKYDWNPNDLQHVEEMSKALRASGRDLIYSLSNSAPIAQAADWARLANSWRTTGDIWDFWDKTDNDWRYGVSEIGFAQDAWVPFAAPGHWNDPDMLVVGWVGWGPQLHHTHLSANEQYAHISLWSLLSAPLLIGCDLERLDPFTISLLSNDEVLQIDQDALGRQASRVATIGGIDVYKKELEDGGVALGFFNRGAAPETELFNKLSKIGVGGHQHVRDCWRQQDLPDVQGKITVTVPAHGVLLLKFTQAK